MDLFIAVFLLIPAVVLLMATAFKMLSFQSNTDGQYVIVGKPLIFIPWITFSFCILFIIAIKTILNPCVIISIAVLYGTLALNYQILIVSPNAVLAGLRVIQANDINTIIINLDSSPPDIRIITVKREYFAKIDCECISELQVYTNSLTGGNRIDSKDAYGDAKDAYADAENAYADAKDAHADAENAYADAANK